MIYQLTQVINNLIFNYHKSLKVQCLIIFIIPLFITQYDTIFQITHFIV